MGESQDQRARDRQGALENRRPQNLRLFEGLVIFWIFEHAMTVSAVRPWRTASQRERRLPSGVVGPVLRRRCGGGFDLLKEELIQNPAE